ncbi:hypothetical protein B0H10DRAFT_2210243 [Mycena sp. CBHHK59/15]|nr:hypothetical protein B0H10DRAFT_2210243 [Mycena sp. CBHHK59/15]
MYEHLRFVIFPSFDRMAILGIKLLIGMYDQNALKTTLKGIDGFYTDSAAITAFNNRIEFILSTHNKFLNNRLVRDQVTDKKQLIFTGGGAGNVSVQPLFFDPSRSGADAIALHDYCLDYSSFMAKAISSAQAAGKKPIVEEWGSLVDADRARNHPHSGEDYEIQVNGTHWSTISDASLAAANLTGAVDFSASLAL